jgi:lipoprotein signal peptidase
MYLLMVPQYRWASRYPIAILVGTALGLGLSSRILPNLQNQVIDTITYPAPTTALGWFNFAYIAIGTLLVLMYFILTYEHSGPLAIPSKAARIFIMLGLGIHFGNTVLFRLAMLSGRAEFVLKVLRLIPW